MTHLEVNKWRCPYKNYGHMAASISNVTVEEVGTLVDLGEYPYMVIIGESCGGDDVPEDWYLDEVICQGTLVAQAWVLTASRCDTHQQLWETTYYALTGFLTTSNITRATRKAIIEWIPFGEENEISIFTVDDILLCKLIDLVDGVELARLPPITWQLGREPEPPDQCLSDCWYVGWKNDTAAVLIKIQVALLSIVEFFHRTQLIGISANLYVNQTPELSGITGGALICGNIQVGIYLSTVEDVGVYTKIATYRPWLDNVLQLDAINSQLRISAVANERRRASPKEATSYDDSENEPFIKESVLFRESRANTVSCLTFALVVIICKNSLLINYH